MFEIGIFCVILFAIGYWVTLFIAGRREDVLHGEFVEAEPELMPAPAGAPLPIAIAAPVYTAPSQRMPVKPMVIRPMSATKAVPAKPVSVPPPVLVSEPGPVIQAPTVASTPAAPVPPRLAAEAPVNTDALQSLLLSIKQELKNAAQI